MIWFRTLSAVSLPILLAGSLSAQLARPLVRVIQVGDSTVDDASGWGSGFRAYFGADVEIANLAKYVEAVRDLTATLKVPLIDPYSLTLAQAEKLGPDGCAEIDTRLPDGKCDQTHLGPKGRQEIGRIAAQEFVTPIPSMRGYAAPAQFEEK